MENKNNTWKSRRKMAWFSLISMIIVTFVLIFIPLPIERLKVISEFIVYFYFGVTGIVGSYVGFKAVWKE